jgi:hypothetical protein
MRVPKLRNALVALILISGLLPGSALLAQVTPAEGHTPPDDTPSIKVGVTIFTDYTYTDEPTMTDVDGNVIHADAFNVSRAYINVTGNINHLVSFRLTPDIVRETTTNTGLAPGQSVSTNLDGSLTFRLKYAYGQFNLDRSLSKGSWFRLGQQQTPYVTWVEDVYRYRFQGTIFVDRDGYLSSSDFGGSFHYNFTGNYGDVHVGYYNGDTYTKAETNDQKAIQARVSFRPAPMRGVIKGLRLTAFYDADNYARNDDRTRLIYAATFEHRFVNVGYEHLDATDQKTSATAKVKAAGYSVWATPKLGKGWELLLRYDSLKPDKNVDDAKERSIGGVAYWFKTQLLSATASLLLDYERVNWDSASGNPDEKRYALHALFAF